jgi:mannose-6-phosphate isomerase-like protein (cupin superfamily)
MKRLFFAGLVIGILGGFYAGRHANPTPGSLIPTVFAQQPQPAQQTGTLPFGFNRPGLQPLAPDAPQPMHWSIDDIRKAHDEMAARARQAAAPAGGSSQAVGGGSLIRVRTRTHSMTMLFRRHREAPVSSLTGVMSRWDDAEQHAGVYDFYVITGGTGEMVVGGEIEARKNLTSPDGLVPGEYRGQPIKGGQTFRVKPGDWLLIPPDAPHQPKPDPGGLSYMLMKINVGMYPWNLIR